MRRKRSGVIMSTVVVLLTILSLSTCDGVRRNAQRRKDSFRSAPGLQMPTPTAESLAALAEATGAAGFEHYTEGRALVKRLIRTDTQSDLDVVEHQGVIGKAGVDFPAYPSIPNTGFSCKNVPTGYYADLETDCQVFHICDTSRKISFLCPNGTIFSQSHLICDWWFKVDCASSPALYESSAEYYSNEQKRSRKVTQSLSKNHDLQQIGTNTNVRAESRRAPVNVPSVPSTTERFLKHRQKLQNDFGSPLNNVKATARSFQAFFNDKNFNPTQKSHATTAFDKKRKNLVQLITNTFGNTRTTLPSYTEASTHRSTAPVVDNFVKEMQVAAETASFAANNNRQFLQDYNSKNFRPYPVYTPNLPKVSKTKSNPNLTTLYDIRDKNLDEYIPDSTTKRSTLVPYTKSYTNILNEKLEPYTRPGVSLLKGFLEKEKNKTRSTTTETYTQATEKSDKIEKRFSHDKKITVESKDSFESATKIPQTTRSDTNYFTDTTSSDRYDIIARTDLANTETESTYQERRERLLKKLNLETVSPTETTLPTLATEKFYGNLPNRPGLVVPPSLTPKTLHTLAIYYATALDNLSTTLSPEESDTTTPSIDEYDAISDGLPPLFSSQTINKYDSLFKQGGHNAKLLEEIRLDPNGTYNELADDLSVQQSQNPLTNSPQIRELAQVFTHALSAYLQDPVQFRKVLSDIRPTPPSFGDILTTEEPSDAEPTTTINEDDEEILGFSDDNKIRPILASLRDSKALNIATDYTTLDQPTTTITPSTEISSTIPPATSPRNPFRCCGKISASYTTASTTKEVTALPVNFTNLSSTVTQTTTSGQHNSYTISKFGGFQNNSAQNDSPYGNGLNHIGAKPLSEYVQATNLPNAWGAEITSSLAPNLFESKKIKKTSPISVTTTPIYLTETDSFELENEEELQRAHSQSFVGPKNNEIRQGKQLNRDEPTTIVQIPSDDLEVPTVSDTETTTTQVSTFPSTTVKVEESESTTASSEFSSIFTSPDSDVKTTNELSWPSTFENWHSTIILDPFTVNDGLSSTGPDGKTNQQTDQTNSWTTNVATTPSAEYAETGEAAYSSTINVEVSTPGNKIESRFGRLLREPTVTESGTDFTTIADTVAQKAKEIMGGMNSTTTEMLMNVMKKTKSKSVKRLILLLIQTCDDDHNTTAEASKKALLEALMAVSQKDMDEIASESDTDNPIAVSTIEFSKSTTLDNKAEPILDRQESKPKQSDRRGKSLEFDATAINSLSNPSTTESITTTEIIPETISTTESPKTTPAVIRRGAKKFLVRTGPVEPKIEKVTFVDIPRAEARVAAEEPESKTTSDTRALELLRSLYTIAARWG